MNTDFQLLMVTDKQQCFQPALLENMLVLLYQLFVIVHTQNCIFIVV